jgi:hypothetical protein
LENRTLTLDAPTGHVEDERVSRRPLFFQMNFLHLNHGKGVWTWVADVYAAALLLLALSGIVILRGPRGFEGRGKWLVLAGLVIPLLILVVESLTVAPNKGSRVARKRPVSSRAMKGLS